MWNDLVNSPLLSGLLGGILVAAAGWTTAFFQRGKQRAQLVLTQQEHQTTLAMAQQELQSALSLAHLRQEAELEKIRLETQIAVAQQAHAQTLALEAAKAEQLMQQQAMAMILASATNEQRQAATLVTAKLSDIALVTEQTHAATNGTRTAMERTEQELRAKVQTLEVASRTEAAAAAVQVAAEREINARLTQQLAAMTPLPVPLPVVVVEPPPEERRIIS